MSHTTPAIAITELQGQLADAKAEVASSLSYPTDCRTAVAVSSFATSASPRGTFLFYKAPSAHSAYELICGWHPYLH